VRYTYTTIGDANSGAVDVGNIYIKLVPKADRDVSVEELAAVMRS
jgi:hydrophobic/amphiphilic exporter-1 (mainly G- bacteria), HAE1 family